MSNRDSLPDDVTTALVAYAKARAEVNDAWRKQGEAKAWLVQQVKNKLKSRTVVAFNGTLYTLWPREDDGQVVGEEPDVRPNVVELGNDVSHGGSQPS